ncbi:MAG: metalloregulator ArsR/SmtB family transcription factor [Proteobacteria bacterium]|nr:metalloregulator ArsR/SmtB family transcription factor [Pseudomonadota bacterium]
MSNPELNRTRGDHADVFTALGDVTRLGLIATLSDGEARSIVQLADRFPLTRQAITKHLRVLEQAGIVRSERTGRESHYAYVPGPIEKAGTYLKNVSVEWDDALTRLRTFVER